MAPRGGGRVDGLRADVDALVVGVEVVGDGRRSRVGRGRRRVGHRDELLDHVRGRRVEDARGLREYDVGQRGGPDEG